MYISSPIAFPIAKVLDLLLGEHTKSRFLNNDLKALIELHTINALENMNIIEKKNEKCNNALLNDQSDSPNHNISNIQFVNENAFGLNQDQANLMISAIDITERKAIDLIIPLKNTFMISYDDNLDKFKIGLMLDKGFSRIPVYTNNDKNDIIGKHKLLT